ncbi:hypothetical protein ASF53_14140 [Methylobacterium sp. Leaf123]|nr:hypothetical protein ASF53_14140 [Methylobacterium sp. Leaf123]
MFDAAIDGAEQGQQPRPGGTASLKYLFGIRAKLHPQRRERIEAIVALLSEEQQTALFRREQEDEPHHHGEARFVEGARLDVA